MLGVNLKFSGGRGFLLDIQVDVVTNKMKWRRRNHIVDLEEGE